MVLEGAGERIKREHNGRAWLAYHVAGLMRMKKMPRFDTLTYRDRQQREPQTWQQIFAAVQILNAASGGVVRKKKKV